MINRMPLHLSYRWSMLVHRVLEGSRGHIVTRKFKAFRRKNMEDPSAWINISLGEKLLRLERGQNVTTFVRQGDPDSGKWATLTDVFDTHTRHCERDE